MESNTKNDGGSAVGIRLLSGLTIGLENASQETRAKLLGFVTALSAPPTSGLDALEPPLKSILSVGYSVKQHGNT